MVRVYRVMSGWIETFTLHRVGITAPDDAGVDELHPAASTKIPVMRRAARRIYRVVAAP